MGTPQGLLGAVGVVIVW